MFVLQLTLVVKIVLTLTLWSVLLLIRPDLVVPNGGPSARHAARGWGASNLALLVMYTLGLSATFDGQVPWYAIGAGLVSNGLGAVLSGTALRRAVGTRDRAVHGFNTVALAGITAGLAASGLSLL